ncbi:MAG TPA: carboxypeptidase regulatory-like domain-containing protein, partial [Terriglobia bacterium]|nr:carboxypeptidase regulatory-like domain-containing protein [Terriglobia bacterium]
GAFTGLGMADFLTGQLSSFSQTVPNGHYMKQSWVGLYGQDTWKVKPRLTMNYGLRWEPFLPQVSTNGRVYNFDHNRFLQGVRSTVFKNAPAGLYYPGDPGFPDKSGINKQWLNFAPRVGLAWDATGDGRTSVRAFYGLAYDYLPLQWRVNAGRVPPWSTQINLNSVALDNPWASFPGGNPFPIKLDQNAAFFPSASYETTPYNIHTTYVSSWNVSLQRQIGMNYLVSATYLGTQTVHMWVQRPLNPAVYIPGGQCTLNGFTYTPCSTPANTNQRRRLSLERPQDGQFFSALDEFDDGGTQSYKGLLLSVLRRASRGISLIGNYTLSYCTSDYGDTNGFGPSPGTSYLDPNNRRFDRGNCDSDLRHIFNLAAIAETPQFTNRGLRTVAGGWRFAGIYRKSSGAFLTVTMMGIDQALTGIANQRPNQVLENPYGDTSGRPLTRYLNPSAFSVPGLGTLGNMARATIQGLGTWQFDTALSKIIRIRGGAQNLEFRAEAYNVTNSFRPENPSTVLNTAVFGQIRSSLDPRIMQFALKYLF